MIKPTVGRVIHFYQKHGSGDEAAINGPFAALVCHVHSDTVVNLSVFDANGVQFPRTSVYLDQKNPDDSRGEQHGSWCEWMDYQIEQAAKG